MGKQIGELSKTLKKTGAGKDSYSVRKTPSRMPHNRFLRGHLCKYIKGSISRVVYEGFRTFVGITPFNDKKFQGYL